jgi:hypothetical protein
MNKEKLKEILDKHKKWLMLKDGGACANLSEADLSGADLSGADLRGADLIGANLHGADLRGADLRGANLHGANLSGADLCGADLCGASLSGASLSGADLCEVRINERTVFYALQCPEKGAYMAFKKAGGYIVELEIPEDALRSFATTRKCRASKAKVISITSVDGENSVESIASDYDSKFIYKTGETVEVPDFDTDRWNECAAGIHHFITRAEAEQY